MTELQRENSTCHESYMLNLLANQEVKVSDKEYPQDTNCNLTEKLILYRFARIIIYFELLQSRPTMALLRK